MSAPHERAEADLLRLIARAVGRCELDPADVTASGRWAWTWHHVDEEMAALLGRSLEAEHRRN
jgi:hypothetical protein